jgi:hypothetical protein
LDYIEYIIGITIALYDVKRNNMYFFCAFFIYNIILSLFF